MTKKETSLLEAMQMFSDEEKAEAWFAEQRWPDGPRCPRCAKQDIARRINRNPMPFYCRKCRRYFSVTSGTLFAKTRIPLRKWALAMYLMSVAPKGVSSVQMGKFLDISQPSAWFMMHRIRQMWNQAQIRTGTSRKNVPEIVECDETYIGGKIKNRPLHKRRYIGRGPVDKHPVIGMVYRRNGFVAAHPIHSTNRATLQRFILSRTDPQTRVYTDEHPGYRKMPRYHRTVKHSAKQYVNGAVHTNGIESFWAMLKRGYGTYHWWSSKHMHRYVDEFVGRNNLRLLDPISQMSVMVMLSVGKRLTYDDLTK